MVKTVNLDETTTYALRKAIEERDAAIARVLRISKKGGLDPAVNYTVNWDTGVATPPAEPPPEVAPPLP